jgi:hypothetical protein
MKPKKPKLIDLALVPPRVAKLLATIHGEWYVLRCLARERGEKLADLSKDYVFHLIDDDSQEFGNALIELLLLYLENRCGVLNHDPGVFDYKDQIDDITFKERTGLTVLQAEHQFKQALDTMRDELQIDACRMLGNLVKIFWDIEALESDGPEMLARLLKVGVDPRPASK